MPSRKYKTPLRPDHYYHIYNRGNNKDKIFYHTGDYFFFMAKYRELLSPYVKTYAYCLIPNHFHFLIKIKYSEENIDVSVPNQFRKLFICHTQRINFMQKRTGGLFTKSYQRIEIQEEAYLKQLVIYIHKNPVKHGIENNYKSYIYSSYKVFLSESKTQLEKQETLDWFGGINEFLLAHQEDLTDPKSFGLLNVEDHEIVP